MTMQATGIEDPETGSGTFEAERPHDELKEAHHLACEIENLLAGPSDGEPYSRRLARALARSLIDQLEDLARERPDGKLG
jgi:hypothetical protein